MRLLLGFAATLSASVLSGSLLSGPGLIAPAAAQGQEKPPYLTSLSLDEMKGKQAVVETSAGTIVLDLLPEAAPNHVGYFIELARKGDFDGTAFHAAVRHGIVQGGDPLTKDPEKRSLYGTGGLGVLRAETSSEKHTRGAVSAVIVPGKPDSAGSQFFICVADQPGLDGKHTVFARVALGIRVAEKISEVPVDEKNRTTERVELRSVTIRDRPAPAPEPFSEMPPTELSAYRATLETSAGYITIEFTPDVATAHVRNFLRLAQARVYDGMAFHRVAKGFVIQTGHLPTRKEPLDEQQQAYVRTLAPEFNQTQHVKGTVSMAHGDDPASASTSFFVCTANTPALDGKYTAFGRVVEGMSVLEAIEAAPVQGETPTTRIDLIRVRVAKR
ncbi:MAG: peptidylprolyl isomerase [Acidobacteria bacterium]|nr:MAG: peptidylprolyl isomerase [Acidobacteriota bacterium]